MARLSEMHSWSALGPVKFGSEMTESGDDGQAKFPIQPQLSTL